MRYALFSDIGIDVDRETGRDALADARPAASAGVEPLEPLARDAVEPSATAARPAESPGDAVLDFGNDAGGADPDLGAATIRDDGAGTDRPDAADRFEFREADVLDAFGRSSFGGWTANDAADGISPLGGGSRWAWRSGGPQDMAEEAVVAETGFSADAFTGLGEAVVVIDDGYSPFYDQSRTVASYDFSVANDPFAGRYTLNSHGSWVADVVTDTAEGVDIIHLKVFDDFGGGASFADIEEALAWTASAAPSLDISAVNLSLGTGATDAETPTSLSDEMALLDELGVFTIVGAGNAGADADGVNLLAADPNAIGVSAVDADGSFSSFSQRDPGLTDIAAPGENVAVDTIWGMTGRVSGTSFAAPLVSGTAARLQEASETMLGRRLTDEEFLDILQDSGDAVAGAPSAEGYRVADSNAAVEWFIDNVAMFSDPEAAAVA